MESTQQKLNISRCATRISDESGKVLYGSGILYLATVNQYALVITAAHVIDNMFLHSKDNHKNVKFAMKDSEGNVKIIVFECSVILTNKTCIDNGDIYIHKNYIKQDLVYDVAIICIKKEEWMDGLRSFQINNCSLGDEQIGYGFPESSDNEAFKGNNTILAGESNLKCEVVDDKDGRYVFNYDKKVYDSEISRDQIMNGLSGTGLFSWKNERYILCGIISSPFGGEIAGSQAYASNANLVFDIMEQHNIKIDVPRTFDLYRKLINQEYKIGYEDERDLFDYFVDDLIKNGGLIPEKVFGDGYEDIKCNQLKKGCADYWKGQLKKAVVMAKLKDISIDNMKYPRLKMPDPYSNYEVEIKFICTDENLGTVVTNLLEHNYFRNGRINNNTIFLWNNHTGNKEDIAEYSRKRFRSVMTSIVGGKKSEYTSKEMADKLSSLMNQSNGFITFDIISGDIKKCNLALLGTNRMLESFEVISQTDYLDRMKDNFDSQLIKLWEE